MAAGDGDRHRLIDDPALIIGDANGVDVLAGLGGRRATEQQVDLAVQDRERPANLAQAVRHRVLDGGGQGAVAKRRIVQHLHAHQLRADIGICNLEEALRGQRLVRHERTRDSLGHACSETATLDHRRVVRARDGDDDGYRVGGQLVVRHRHRVGDGHQVTSGQPIEIQRGGVVGPPAARRDGEGVTQPERIQPSRQG